MWFLLGCGLPTCPDGEALTQDGLCVPRVDADTDTDVDTDTDTDTDADTDTDTDTDTGTAFPFDIYVCPAAGGDFDTIQAGVDAAVEGQTVGVCPAWYHECVTVDKSIEILSSSGGDTTWVDGDGTCASMSVTSATVRLSGLSLVNGTAALIAEDSIVNADTTYFRDHITTGAVVDVLRGSLSIDQSWFKDNDAEISIRTSGTDIEVRGVEFAGVNNGTAISLDTGSAAFYNSRFLMTGGGVVLEADAPVLLENTTFVLDADTTGVIAGAGTVIRNSIFTGEPDAVALWDAGLDVTYSDFFGIVDRCNDIGCIPIDGEGILHADPELVDFNRNISATSPCVDAGNPDAAYNDVDATRNDMGSGGGPGGI